MILLLFFLAIVILEFFILSLIRYLRKDFQWLITEDDECPTLPSNALNKFLGSSFDKELGWVRRPNTTGIEKGKNGDINFYIDNNGARVSTNAHLENKIAVFGDSYAFCRQVKDNETWEEEISEILNIGVMNFGVGNYGVDQGLLRYQSSNLPESVDTAIMCFVPETICRIQSYWKHYLEFGNTFAFKPRFIITRTGDLKLVKNIIHSEYDFKNLKEKLSEIQLHDEFYLRKFRKYQFRIPYLFSLIRNPRRQFSIIYALILKKLSRFLNIQSEFYSNLPFSLVMQQNIREAQAMYTEQRPRKLLEKILLKFIDEAKIKNHRPLILVIPQLLDFHDYKTKEMPYSIYFKEIAKEIDFIDMADILKKQELTKMYVNDQYGGHLSVEGNKLVAKSVCEWLK